jgi:hypothetical protein
MLAFTVNEQNCLALVCELLASVSHQVNEVNKEPTERHIDDLIAIVEKFPNTNWGDLYDRFHRQGRNQ